MEPTYQELLEHVAELIRAVQQRDLLIQQLEEENARLRMQLRGSPLDALTDRLRLR